MVLSVKIRFYETSSGARPAEKYIASLPLVERAKVLAAIEDVRKFGLEDSGVTFRHISGKLWEIKVSAQRVFYVVISGPEMVLMHAYKKEGQKAPRGEIATAQRRMKDVLGE